MRTLLWFLGAAAIAMAVAGTLALHPNIVYFGLMGMGVVSIAMGFWAREEL